MHKFLILITVFFSITLLGKDPVSERIIKSVSVVGICEKKVTPDRSYVTITITEKDLVQAESSKKANDKYNKLVEIIKKMKLKNEELETTEYRVYPDYSYNKGKKVFKGMVTTLTLKVTTSELEKVGRILVSGNKLGLKNVAGPKSFVSTKKYQETYKSCLAVASKDAKEKGLLLANKLDAGLGEVISISEGRSFGTHRPPVMMEKVMAMGEESLARAPKIQFGKNEIKVHLSVIFKLK